MATTEFSKFAGILIAALIKLAKSTVLQPIGSQRVGQDLATEQQSNAQDK